MGTNCPVSCRREPVAPWRHVAKGLAIQVQHSTQPGMHGAEQLGAKQNTGSDDAKGDSKWEFPSSWPTYRTAVAVFGGIIH